MRTYIVGGNGVYSYRCGIFTCLPIHYVDGDPSQGSRLSLFSALTKFSDYHAPETANSNEFFTGQHAVTINSCGVFAEYVTVTQSANKVYLGSLPN